MTQTTQALPFNLPQQVHDFAVEQGVSEYLPAVLEMTQRVFDNAPHAVEIEEDAEIANDRHIVVVVRVPRLRLEDVAQALKKRWEWHQGLFESCPAPLVCVFRHRLEHD